MYSSSPVISSPQYQSAQVQMNAYYLAHLAHAQQAVDPPRRWFKRDPFANRAGRVALAQHIETTSGRPL